MPKPTLAPAILACVALSALPAWGQAPPDYTIATAAGNGSAGFDGDGGPATNAVMNFPGGLAFDADGNLYISDSFNARVRRVDTGGTITTVAGNGDRTFDGDGGQATAAGLSSPYGLAFDSAGNLYIADTLSNAIRRVGTNGIINTIAGIVASGFAGDGGPAEDSAFNTPLGLAVDGSDNLYIADARNHRIRKIDTAGMISSIAGNGQGHYAGDGAEAVNASLNHPEAVAVDSIGNIYIADTFNHRIRKINLSGVITTIAGNGTPGFAGDEGPAAEAQLWYPRGIAVDDSGNVFVADKNNNRIRMITEDGVIHTIAGSGLFGDFGGGVPAQQAQLRFPLAVALGQDGKVYFVDSDNSKVKVLTPSFAAPALDEGGVISSSAFGGFSGAAPGSWVELYGDNLAARTREWSEHDFAGGSAPRSLAGTRVTIAGREAVLSYVSRNQVNVQIPEDVPTGGQMVQVHTTEGSSESYALQIDYARPGLLAPAAFAIDGVSYAAAVTGDGQTYVLPAGAAAVVPARTAVPGETITFYGTGFGALTGGVAADEVAPGEAPLQLEFSMSFDGTPAVVTYAGLAPGSLGLYQFNVVVPSIAASDQVELTFTLGGEPGEQTLFTAVGQ